jgi:hypothetical protein
MEFVCFMSRSDTTVRLIGKSGGIPGKSVGPFTDGSFISAPLLCCTFCRYLLRVYPAHVNNSHNTAVKRRLHWRSRELVPTGEERKQTWCPRNAIFLDVVNIYRHVF